MPVLSRFMARLQGWARALKRDVMALWFCARHPALPWWLRLLTLAETHQLAFEKHELDLIEIAATAVPPVVKIGNYGSYLYQIKKKEKRQRAHSKQTEVKMIRFGFRTDCLLYTSPSPRDS